MYSKQYEQNKMKAYSNEYHRNKMTGLSRWETYSKENEVNNLRDLQQRIGEKQYEMHAATCMILIKVRGVGVKQHERHSSKSKSEITWGTYSKDYELNKARDLQ